MHEPPFDPSRRALIKQCVIGGVAVYSAPLLLMANPGAKNAAPGGAPVGWRNLDESVAPGFRYDAVAKVCGEKIFSRDYRARDMFGWPNQQHYGLVLRAPRADAVYEGLDLGDLSDEIKPYRVVSAEDLGSHKLHLPPYYGDHMLVKPGAPPDFMGHPVAILLFDDFVKYKRAKSDLQFNPSALRFGRSVTPTYTRKDPYASWRIIREQGASPGAPDQYSTLKDGLFFPDIVNHRPQWNASPDKNGNTAERGMYYANKLREDIASGNDYVLKQRYQTQSVEPMSMEPEAFNGWLDSGNATLHVVICSQSPQDFHRQAGGMLAKSPLTTGIKNLVVHTPYIGGGFGGKDHTIFPYYGVLASLFSEAPIRVANDRFQQFQSGLKRHPFIMDNQLAIDRESLKITGLVSDMTLDGGGRVNFSPSVTSVGATAIQSIYYLPRSDVRATCYPSDMPTAGSMRGYGTLQTMAAMEMMINQSAADLNVDTFKLRRVNAMRPGQPNAQGALPNGDVRYVEMLDVAEQHPIWQQREGNKKKFEQAHPGWRYGVGFGIASKDYGTGAQAPSALVEVTPEGRIHVKNCSVEMGTGTETSQATLVARYLGKRADTVSMAETQLFDAMELLETDDPYLMSQETQDKHSKDPHWTPVIAMASSASQSAYYQSHATAQAARILFEQALFPAAVAILKEHYFNSAYAVPDFDDISLASWSQGGLTIAGNIPLALERIVARAREMDLPLGVMVHTFNRWAWAEAEFVINGNNCNYPVDAIALKYAKGTQHNLNKFNFQVANRLSVNYPRVALNNAFVTYYTPCATLAEIAVNAGDGTVKVLRAHTWLEPGTVHVEKLVEGQIEGGLAMGVGHALHEYLPSGNEGAGDGTWNLNRYQVPLAKHVGVWNIKHTLIPPSASTDPAKGIAEVVMIPIVSALVEAIYQATGKRFYHLPVSAEDIMEAFQ